MYGDVLVSVQWFLLPLLGVNAFGIFVFQAQLFHVQTDGILTCGKDVSNNLSCCLQ